MVQTESTVQLVYEGSHETGPIRSQALILIARRGSEERILVLTSKLDQDFLTEVRGERLSIPKDRYVGASAAPCVKHHCQASAQFQLICSAGIKTTQASGAVLVSRANKPSSKPKRECLVSPEREGIFCLIPQIRAKVGDFGCSVVRACEFPSRC